VKKAYEWMPYSPQIRTADMFKIFRIIPLNDTILRKKMFYINQNFAAPTVKDAGPPEKKPG
jgi:hypothetical protein